VLVKPDNNFFFIDRIVVPIAQEQHVKKFRMFAAVPVGFL
jgi:hypothetical protein